MCCPYIAQLFAQDRLLMAIALSPPHLFQILRGFCIAGGWGMQVHPCHPEVAMVEKGGCNGSIFL